LSIALANHLAEILGPDLGQVNQGEKVGGFSARWMAKNPHFTHPMKEDVK
jgi:hypothetical protein